ncbi:hypothetical protein ACFX1R_014720 [Malus domestica]
MQEFHKKYSANDLYDLPRAWQDTLDLVLACPDAECIIQKTSDPRMKARYQHIHKAQVLGCTVDPYTDIDIAELPFSLKDLQYLRYHFEAVSIFGFTIDEMERVAWPDAYLDTRDAHITYQEETRKASHKQCQVITPTESKVNVPNEEVRLVYHKSISLC